MPPIDWLHLAAVALGAVGTFFLRKNPSVPATPGSPSTPTTPASLLDTILSLLEGRLAKGTESKDGLFTIRVVLVPDTSTPVPKS